MTREILWNQIESDLQTLKEEISTGLYDGNNEGFVDALKRILEKVNLTYSY